MNNKNRRKLKYLLLILILGTLFFILFNIQTEENSKSGTTIEKVNSKSYQNYQNENLETQQSTENEQNVEKEYIETEFKGYKVASLMLVMGIGYDGEYNPYYMENLKLALQIQILANQIYPGLFRPMIIRNSVYNQDIKSNSFLVEVGASGNTLDEAILATRCLSNLLNILYKD